MTTGSAGGLLCLYKGLFLTQRDGSVVFNLKFHHTEEPTDYVNEFHTYAYVRVYKDKNGYDENNRLTKFEHFVKDMCDSFVTFWHRVLSFFQDLCPQCHQFFERLLSNILALYRTANSNL